MKDNYQAAMISKICSHIDIPSEEDVIMRYNITDNKLKTEMERLVSSIEDRKVTLIQQLKFQGCTVTENKEREEDKELGYSGTLLFTRIA